MKKYVKFLSSDIFFKWFVKYFLEHWKRFGYFQINIAVFIGFNFDRRQTMKILERKSW